MSLAGEKQFCSLVVHYGTITKLTLLTIFILIFIELA